MSDAPPIGSGWLEGQRRAVTVLVVLALLSLVLVVMASGCLLPGSTEAVRALLTHMNHLSAGGWGAPAVFPSDRVFAKS